MVQPLELIDETNLPGFENIATPMTSSKKLPPRSGAGNEPHPQEINMLVALFKQGCYAETEALAREMTVRFPQHSFGWKSFGMALLQQGRNEEALTPLQKAIELSRGDFHLHNNLGNALAKLGHLSEAEASYKLALKLNPSFVEAHHNLGNLLKLGQLSEVEKLSIGIVKIQPNQPDTNLEQFDSYLFIIGAQKAGTTSLYSHLNQRSELTGGGIKEKAFFSRDSFYEKGNNYYRSLFPIGSKHSCGMDATSEYFYFRECAKRIHDFCPHAKIVVLLREPVSRAFSAFNMYRQIVHQEWFKQRIKLSNKDVRDFLEPITEGNVEPSLDYYLNRELQIINGDGVMEEPSLIRRGLYAPQLERYIRLFGRENILILFSNELETNTHNTVNKVCKFIGLKPLSYRKYPRLHVREYTVDGSGKELIGHLAGELFAKDKLELARTYGLDVPW